MFLIMLILCDYFKYSDGLSFLSISLSDDGKKSYISHVHIENNTFLINEIVDISSLGAFLSATCNGTLLSMVTANDSFNIYNVYILDIQGNIFDKVSLENNTLSNIQQFDNLFLGISINVKKRSYDIVQIDFDHRDFPIKYDFEDFKPIFIRTTTIDNIRNIYYVALDNGRYANISGISTKDFTLEFKYGPISKQPHYTWDLLADAERLYAFIYNRKLGSVQLVIINIDIKEIETTITYDYSTVYTSTLNGTVIYSIMSDYFNYVFITIDLISKQSKYINITESNIPIYLWPLNS